MSVVCAASSEEFFDRIDRALSFSSDGGEWRGRISGLLDLEGYAFPQPAPALVQSRGQALFNPRLTTFLDAQWGAHVYGFVQARADRGFDPASARLSARLDEYAIRFTPQHDGFVSLQLGKFATVVGNWVTRHESWNNGFITAPLVYENLTGVWDFEPLRSSTVLLQWSHVRPGLPAAIVAREKTLRLPVIWGPSYALGAAVSGRVGMLRYAAEVKQVALSSHPEAWNDVGDNWRHPTVSARLGFRPNAMWDVGLSASMGSYLRATADLTPVRPRGRGDYRQTVIGQDVSFAHHHWQFWAELYTARFAIPTVGNADTTAYYAEARYKFSPQFSAALRWNQQLFGTVPERGVDVRWGRDITRLDLAPTYRISPHAQAKLQYSWQHGANDGRDGSHLLAGQVTVRF